MMTTFMTKTELNSLRGVSDKEINEIFFDLSTIMPNKFFIKEYKTVTKQWWQRKKSAKEKLTYQLYIYAGSVKDWNTSYVMEVQIYNFYRGSGKGHTSICITVSGSTMWALLTGFRNGYQKGAQDRLTGKGISHV